MGIILIRKKNGFERTLIGEHVSAIEAAFSRCEKEKWNSKSLPHLFKTGKSGELDFFFSHTCGRKYKQHRRCFLQSPTPESRPAALALRFPAVSEATAGVSPSLMHSLWGPKRAHKWSRRRSQLVVKSAAQRGKCVIIPFAIATARVGCVLAASRAAGRLHEEPSTLQRKNPAAVVVALQPKQTDSPHFLEVELPQSSRRISGRGWTTMLLFPF